MSVVSEIKLIVSKTINLGNYESVKLEASVLVGRDSDTDTPEKMREQALDEITLLLEDARRENVPKRRQQYDKD